MNTVEATEPTAGVEETQSTAEVPGGPEAVAPSAPADEAATTEQAAPSSTRPRGPDGRFIKADGTQASEAEHAAIEAADVASPPPPVAPPAPASTGQPFVVRGDGQRIPMPGSTLNEKGDLVVTAEHVPTYRQLIAEGLVHRGSWRQERERFEQAKQEAVAGSEAKAEKYHNASLLLWGRVEGLLKNNPQELEFLRRELDLELRSADLRIPKQPEAPKVDEAQQAQQIRQAATETLTEYLEELFETPQAKAVFATPQEREEAKARYVRRLAAYFVEQNGETLLHENAVDADFQDELKIRQAGRLKAEQEKKAQEFNARRNAAPVVPPVVSTKGPSTTGASPVKYKDRDEWRKAHGMV